MRDRPEQHPRVGRENNETGRQRDRNQLDDLKTKDEDCSATKRQVELIIPSHHQGADDCIYCCAFNLSRFIYGVFGAGCGLIKLVLTVCLFGLCSCSASVSSL